MATSSQGATSAVLMKVQWSMHVRNGWLARGTPRAYATHRVKKEEPDLERGGFPLHRQRHEQAAERNEPREARPHGQKLLEVQ